MKDTTQDAPIGAWNLLFVVSAGVALAAVFVALFVGIYVPLQGSDTLAGAHDKLLAPLKWIGQTGLYDSNSMSAAAGRAPATTEPAPKLTLATTPKIASDTGAELQRAQEVPPGRMLQSDKLDLDSPVGEAGSAPAKGQQSGALLTPSSGQHATLALLTPPPKRSGVLLPSSESQLRPVSTPEADLGTSPLPAASTKALVKAADIPATPLTAESTKEASVKAAVLPATPLPGAPMTETVVKTAGLRSAPPSGLREIHSRAKSLDAADQAKLPMRATGGASHSQLRQNLTVPSASDAPHPAFSVQLWTLRSPDNIAEEWARLQKSIPKLLGDLKPAVEMASSDEKGDLYRVRIGSFINREAAKAMCAKLKALKQDCLVITLTATSKQVTVY
jgi:hypothetical protein